MKKYDLAVKTGTYQSAAGEKGRYETIGEVHSGDKGFFTRLNPYRVLGIAMSAIARGDDSILVSMFAPKDQVSPAPQHQMPQQANFDQDVPF